MTKTAREAGVARLAEGFMVPRVWQCDVWEIDGNQGTAYVPADVAGIARTDDVIDDRRVGKFAQYYNGQTIETVTYRANVWCAQLSAPGYMDLTCDHCGKHIESAYGETR
jgi:hypothetical protein